MNLEQGKKLVKLARLSISNYFEKKETKTQEFKDKGACFVTLLTFPEKELRGCIGYIEPIFPLSKSLISSALSAAFSDNRFRPLTKRELDEIIIEVSILTKPELLKVKDPKEYLKKIELGKHGLILNLDDAFHSVFLPQVPIEQKWSAEELLNQLCMKAGLLEDTWKHGSCKISTFETKIFEELSPKGDIKEIKIKQ